MSLTLASAASLCLLRRSCSACSSSRVVAVCAALLSPLALALELDAGVEGRSDEERTPSLRREDEGRTTGSWSGVMRSLVLPSPSPLLLPLPCASPPPSAIDTLPLFCCCCCSPSKLARTAAPPPPGRVPLPLARPATPSPPLVEPATLLLPPRREPLLLLMASYRVSCVVHPCSAADAPHRCSVWPRSVRPSVDSQQAAFTVARECSGVQLRLAGWQWLEEEEEKNAEHSGEQLRVYNIAPIYPAATSLQVYIHSTPISSKLRSSKSNSVSRSYTFATRLARSPRSLSSLGGKYCKLGLCWLAMQMDSENEIEHRSRTDLVGNRMLLHRTNLRVPFQSTSRTPFGELLCVFMKALVAGQASTSFPDLHAFFALPHRKRERPWHKTIKGGKKNV